MNAPLSIVAVRQSRASEVRHAFGRIYGKLAANLAIRENFGWTWFKPPAGTPRELIAQVLAAFRRPAIYVETAPRQWTLEVFCRDRAPVRFVQTLPAADEAWPVVDLAPWETAFLEAEIPFDVDKVGRALQGQDLTPAELADPLGNLPRVLAGLGLGGEWARRIAPPAPPFQFSLGVVFALTVVGATLLSAIRFHPGWGFLLTVILGLAFVRTASRVGQKGVQTSGEQLNLLARSCGVAVVILSAWAVSYLAIAFGVYASLELLQSSISPYNNRPFLVFAGGLFPATAIMALVAQKLW